MTEDRPIVDANIPRKGRALDDHLARHLSDPAPPLSLVEFNLTGLCNRKCEFCPRVDPAVFPNVNVAMTVELYQKVVEDLAAMNFDGIILYSAFGEPLLHRRIEELISITRRLCPATRIEVITNGDFVTRPKVRRLFAAGLSTLLISLYDGLHQLKKFGALRRALRLGDDQLVLRKRYLPRSKKFGILLSNRSGLVELPDLGVRKLREPIRESCYYPFYQMLVDYDGAVLLCPHDWGKRLIAGNLNHQSVHEVWTSELMRSTRLSLAACDRGFAPCNGCDVRGNVMGEGHFHRWLDYYGVVPSS